MANVILPEWAAPSDEFKRYDVTDNSLAYLTIVSGSVMLGLRRAFWNGHPHACRIKGRIYVGCVDLEGDKLRFSSWHNSLHSGDYEKLDIESVIVRVEIAGGPVWNVAPPAQLAQAVDTSRKLIILKK